MKKNILIHTIVLFPIFRILVEYYYRNVDIYNPYQFILAFICVLLSGQILITIFNMIKTIIKYKNKMK